MKTQVTIEERNELLEPVSEHDESQSCQFFIPTVVDNIRQLEKDNSKNLITYLTLLERNLSAYEKAQVIIKLREK